MGFEGEAIAQKIISKKQKSAKLTRHKHEFDILTNKEAWEVKTVGADAKDIKMTVKGSQKIAKETWAAKNKKEIKSMLVVINDKIDVFVRDGVGGFRPNTMKKLGTFDKSEFE